MKTATNTFAKMIVTLATIFSAQMSFAQTWTFTYKPKNQASFQIKKQASNKEDAFKIAAKECFNTLTHGNYPGESQGLDYIDVCANPKM